MYDKHNIKFLDADIKRLFANNKNTGPQGGVYAGGYNVMQNYIDAPWTFEVVGKTPLQ